MSNENKVRLAHELLDEINARQDLTQEQTEVLRSFLPELPKQKTLEELRHAVYAAWSGTHGNKWLDDVDGDLETWLYELHTQLKGLKDTPAAVPALPEGLRLAIHDQYGRCVVSPESDANGVCEILYTDSDSELGSNYDYAHQCELTFIDAEPAHPEFLETEADYENAPEGTIVAEDTGRPVWRPNEHWFINNNPFDNREMAGGLRPAPRRVLRWGK